MAASVLGKRTRSSARRIAQDTGVVTRAKRQIPIVIGNDENENPFVTRKRRVADADPVDSEPDELSAPVKRCKTSAKPDTVTVPAKHGSAGGRVALSPSKISNHFKTSKAAVSGSVEVDWKVPKATPQTPRRRDAASKKVPITPRHRVGVVGKPLTPQSLHTLTTPRGSCPTLYNEARQTFALSGQPGQLVGRENERQELVKFITRRIESNSSGCIYISGPPGTGKSALVNGVGQSIAETKPIKASYINCMSIKNTKDLCGKLLEDLSDEIDTLTGNELEDLRALFFGGASTYVVTLDEIDHVLDVDLELLYTLFEWSLQESSSLVLIGIANALDFTNRFLPRLKARNLNIQLLPFMPYTANQIATVITHKLQSLLSSDELAAEGYVPFIHPTAIQFVAKKVAAQSGDLRKAFDICRSAIDMIESETKAESVRKATMLTPQNSPSRMPLVQNINLSSPSTTYSPQKTARQVALAASLADLTPATAPRATIAHMARITARVFGNGTTQRLQPLNLQQKAVLCALSALEKKNRLAKLEAGPSTPSKRANEAPTIRALCEAYKKLCKRDQILHPLTATEFRDVVGSLETLSLVTAVEAKSGFLPGPVTPSKRGRGGFGATLVEERRIASVVGEAELLASLEGPGSVILRDILRGDGLV